MDARNRRFAAPRAAVLDGDAALLLIVALGWFLLLLNGYGEAVHPATSRERRGDTSLLRSRGASRTCWSLLSCGLVAASLFRFRPDRRARRAGHRRHCHRARRPEDARERHRGPVAHLRQGRARGRLSQVWRHGRDRGLHRAPVDAHPHPRPDDAQRAQRTDCQRRHRNAVGSRQVLVPSCRRCCATRRPSTRCARSSTVYTSSCSRMRAWNRIGSRPILPPRFLFPRYRDRCVHLCRATGSVSRDPAGTAAPHHGNDRSCRDGHRHSLADPPHRRRDCIRRSRRGRKARVRRPTLSSRMAAVLTALRRLQGSPDAEAVHDLRVTVRRCRSIGAIMKEVDPHPAWRRMTHQVRGLFQALGELRDLQVLEEWIEKLTQADDPLRASLIETLRQREAELRERVTQAVEAFDRKAWRRLARVLGRRGRLVTPESAAAECLALERYLALRRLHARAMRRQTPASWHRLRIGLKKFRYAVENRASAPLCALAGRAQADAGSAGPHARPACARRVRGTRIRRRGSRRGVAAPSGHQRTDSGAR